MSFRIAGLVPAVALLVMGVAHAQSANQATTGGGGSMAYPDSLPSGQVKVQAPTARDTGSMAYPASPGGVAVQAPTAPDTGSMQTPAAAGSLTHPMPMHMKKGAKPMGTEAAASGGMPMAQPSPAGMKAAQALNTAPGSQPVPYVDFAPAPAAKAGHKMMHHSAVKKAAATTTAK